MCRTAFQAELSKFPAHMGNIFPSGVIHSTAGKDAGLVPCRNFNITLDTLYECFGVRFSAPWFTHMWIL